MSKRLPSKGPATTSTVGPGAPAHRGGIVTRRMSKVQGAAPQPKPPPLPQPPIELQTDIVVKAEPVSVKLASQPDTGPSNPIQGSGNYATEEIALLDHGLWEDNSILEDHELITAPLFTREAYLNSGFEEDSSQYGVLGRILSIHDPSGVRVPEEPRLYVNTNAPFSALATTVCPPSVRVYVSKSSLARMKQVYAPLGDKVSVRSLRFSQSELDAQAILSMMAVGSSESAPLYMHSILSILRELGDNFTYKEFLSRTELAKRSMNPQQRGSLDQRLSLLASFVDSANPRKGPLFRSGRVTIIDLSDPFIDPSSACSLFEIITRLFVRADIPSGKVLVTDEAHKYLSANHGDSGLTKALTSIIRQQRHLAMRVIISTQEPTAVPPVLIDLCSIAIFHRFSSPAWWEAVARRVCADVSNTEGFGHVVKLKTGQALVLCPSGLGLFASSPPKKPTAKNRAPLQLKIGQFGRRYMLIKTRQRITMDGGASILATDA
ncbi:hypothetical protein C8Q74DRAFT_1448046 [Fomes fomentarius]|nr:hypothetical protein C8Q74DRAFT_1448046 [Fomes fomentarius]